MNLDEMKAAWQCQGTTEFAGLDREALLEHLKTERRRFDRVMFWTDVFVAGTYVAFVVFMYLSLSGRGITWPFYPGAALVLLAAAHHPWRNRQRKKKERQFGNSLRDELKKKSDQLDYQIRFARWDSIWGYYLPTIIALELFTWQMVLNGDLGIVEFQGMALFFIVFLGGLGYGVGGVAIPKARKQKREIDRELEALGCPVTEKKTPVANRVARALLVVGALVVCGYLLLQILTPDPVPENRSSRPPIPGGAPRFARVAPFTGDLERRRSGSTVESRLWPSRPHFAVEIRSLEPLGSPQ